MESNTKPKEPCFSPVVVQCPLCGKVETVTASTAYWPKCDDCKELMVRQRDDCITL